MGVASRTARRQTAIESMWSAAAQAVRLPQMEELEDFASPSALSIGVLRLDNLQACPL